MATSIRRRSKMTVALGVFIAIFLTAAFVIVPAAQAGEKTVKYKVVAPITKMEVIPVSNMKGYLIGMLERRGVAIYENGETAAYHSQVIFDIAKGQTTWSAYSDLSFPDGSTTITKGQGTAWGKMPHFIKGTGKYIKGTGRFEGIKGECSIDGKSVTPYTKDKTKGDAVLDFTSTYTLPKK